MATAMIAALVLLAQDPQPPTAPDPETLENALVIATGDPRSLPDAGVVAPHLALEVLIPAGERMMLYLLRVGRFDPAPPVGATCSFEIGFEPMLRGTPVATPPGGAAPVMGQPVATVSRFDCRITSDSPTIGPEGLANP